MIAVSKQIQSVPLPDLQTSCEILWVKLNFQKCRDLYLGAFYRPHVSDQFSLEQLSYSLNKLTNHANNPIIWSSGDFNSPDIEWQTFTIPPGSANTYCQQLLVDIAHDHNLSQTVLHPTRLHNIYKLDLFLTNYPVSIQSTQVIPGLSDHDIVIIESKIKPLFLKQTNRKILLYNKADWQSCRWLAIVKTLYL